jgi:biopolymer transport protein ExbB
MRLAPIILALTLAATPAFAQAPAMRPAAPASASSRSPESLSPDTFTIPANPGSTGKKAANPAEPKAAADAAAAEGKGDQSLLNMLQRGGWVIYLLAFLSIVLVMLLLTFLFTLRRGAILTPHFMNTADVLLKKRDYLGLLAISSRHSEIVARIVQRALDFATKNPNASMETIRDIAQTEGGAQAAVLQHRITYLADIGVLSPMVGLFGTVVGIIHAFQDLSSGEATLKRDLVLAGGVSEALIATAGGLIIGILAMFFYSIFRNRVHSLISDMEIATAHIMGLITTNFGKKRETTSRVAVEEEF